MFEPIAVPQNGYQRFGIKHRSRYYCRAQTTQPMQGKSWPTYSIRSSTELEGNMTINKSEIDRHITVPERPTSPTSSMCIGTMIVVSSSW